MTKEVLFNYQLSIQLSVISVGVLGFWGRLAQDTSFQTQKYKGYSKIHKGGRIQRYFPIYLPLKIF